MDWWVAVPVAISVAAIAIVLVASLWLRRQWLLSTGGLFDCWFRLRPSTGRGAGWSPGVARYSGEYLEWFPAFSMSRRPRVRLHRPDSQIQGQREPDTAESPVLPSGTCILVVTSKRDDRLELAMSSSSLTGLISWLESAPPGVHYLPRG